MHIRTLLKKLTYLTLLTHALAIPADRVNLEDRAQPFVLKTTRIQLPEYPHAFNPSLIRWNGRLLMSFRVIPNPKQSFTTWIGLVWLDEDLNPVGTPQKLEMRTETSPAPSRAEDGRLITIDNRLFVVYDDNEDPKITRGGFRVYIAELDYDGSQFNIIHTERMTTFPGNDPMRREKSWTPFEYQNKMYLAYSLTPHIILEPLFGTASARFVTASLSDVAWQWGELRGGTAALFDGTEYLGFFHSVKKMSSEHSDDKEILHYFMGAYTFSAEPPFNITRISPEPIVGKNFYSGESYKPYWHPVQAIFPCGYVRDGNRILIAYGRQDHELWIAELDAVQLYESLIPTPQKNELIAEPLT